MTAAHTAGVFALGVVTPGSWLVLPEQPCPWPVRARPYVSAAFLLVVGALITVCALPGVV